MVPNLNKWKFIKLHRKKRIINLGKGNKGKSLSIYNSGIILTSSNTITIKQMDSVKKYINKKLKAKDRVNRRNLKVASTSGKKKKKKVARIGGRKKEKTVILRHNFNLGLTKKPLQVRMGKGKGSPVDWVYPFAKNRIFLEFLSKKVKMTKLLRIFDKAENKLPGKIKVRFAKKLSKNNSKNFNRFDKLVEIKCVKEL